MDKKEEKSKERQRQKEVAEKHVKDKERERQKEANEK
jgi:hypothetical protein